MRRAALFLLAFCLFISCKKNNETPAPVEYLAFGTSYGECAGNCATFYSIADGKIYPDDDITYFYYGGVLKFKTTPLADEKYQAAKQLLNNFPDYLRSHADTSFGCPDCHDQGAIYIEMKQDGVVKKWNIDPVTSRQPDEIKAYIQQLEDVLVQLR